jgi:hypothetical protein
MKKLLFALPCLFLFASCQKQNGSQWHFYEIGINLEVENWRDSSFIVATSNPQLIATAAADLQKPILERHIIFGLLRPGSAGYNHNGYHWFRWHLEENTWQLTDATAEWYDGLPHTDVDRHYHYWMDTVGQFTNWHSYLKKELNIRFDGFQGI